MTDLNDELVKWYEELQQFSPDAHLLCPRTGDDDNENYKTLDDPESTISVEEKEARIKEGRRKIEITYWNSLIFGFDKQDAGKWNSSDDLPRHGDIDREAQVIDPAVEKRVVRK